MSNRIDESLRPRSGRMLATFRVSVALMALVLLVAARSQVRTTGAFCVPTTYVATSTAGAGTYNWTDTSGLWVPGGSYPGAGACDTAVDSSFNPKYIIVNSAIPNGLAGINFSCPGCVIDIRAGGTLTIGGGTGSGTGFITNGASIRLSGGTLVVNTTAANGGLTFDGGGQLELQSGTVTGTGQINIGSTGAMTWGSSSNVTIDTVTINSSGAVYFFPSAPVSLSLNNGASISNSGVTIFSAVASVLTSGGGTINNSGNFIKTGSVPTTVDAVFNNVAGAGVNIQAQSLVLAGGGQGDAPFNINCSACGLEFPSGTYTMNAGGTVSGSGTLSVTGGTLTIGGVTSPTNFTLSSGTLDGPGFLTVGGIFDWSGGTLAGTGGAELAGGGTGSFHGSNGTMSLDGRTLNVYGTVNYTATTNSLDLANGATLAIYGTFDLQDDGSITCTCSASEYVLISPNGVLKKTGGTGTSTIVPEAANDSVVNVTSGTLVFAGDGWHTGQFSAAAGTTLEFAGEDTVLDTGSSFSIAGTLLFSSFGWNDVYSTLTIAGTLAIADAAVNLYEGGSTVNFSMTGGDLWLEAPFTMTGNGTWSIGGIGGDSDSGKFIVAGGATLLLDAAGCVPTLYAIELVNDGTIHYTPTLVSTNHFEMVGALLTNNGTFDMQADAPIKVFGGLVAEGDALASPCAVSTRQSAVRNLGTGRQVRSEEIFVIPPSAIVNNGTWKKTDNAVVTFDNSAAAVGDVSEIEPPFTNNGSVLAQTGTMSFTTLFTQAAGTTSLEGGHIASPDATIFLNGGSLVGAGTVEGNLENNAMIAPGSGLTTGVISVTDSYAQGNSGTMDIGIAGPAAGQFDQVAIANTGTLGGTFKATLLGGYIPAHGTSWPVLTYGTLAGAFATETLPTFPPTGTVTRTYTPTAYVLTANVAALSSDLSAGMTGPAGVMAGAPLSYAVTITNNGPNDHTGTITVTNTLPNGATGATGSGTGWSCGLPSAGVITCTSGTALNNTQSLPVLTFNMTAPASGGNVSNSATVSSGTGDPNGGNNTAFVNTNVTPLSSDLSAGMTGPGTVNAGAALSYAVTITNNGPHNHTGTITVTNVLPNGAAGATGSGTGWSCSPPSDGIITCTNSTALNNTQSLPVLTFNMTAPANGGSVSNTATVSSGTNDPNTGNNTAFAGTNVIAQTDLMITKNGPAGVTAGQNVTYTIVVTNNGPSTATGVVVSDPQPANLTFVSNSGACTTPFPCSLGTLTSGQAATITSTWSTSPSFSGNVTNIATVTRNEADPNNTNNSANATTNVGAQANLSITKTGPASTTTGQDVIYTITYTNNGPSPATSTVISDPAPVGIAFQQNTGSCTTPFPCNVGTLAAGQSGTITSRYSVPPNYTGTSISNTASIASAVNDPDTSNNSSTTVTNVSQTADVGVVKTGPTSASPGQNIVYTVTVSNAGPASAGSVVVSDTTPTGLTFVSNSGACTTAYPCNVGILTAGQSVTITSTYSIPVGHTGTSISNTASVTSGATDGNGANNSSTAVTPLNTDANVSVSKTGPAIANPGQNIVYTVTVSNAGPASAGNVVVSDTTPAGLTFVSNTGACTTAYPCNLGTLTSGQSQTITSTYAIPANYSSPSIVNTASVTSAAPDASTANNTSTVTTTILASADLSITKSGPATFALGQNVVYTIAVTNAGPLSAANTFVNDPTPAGLTFVSNSGACTGGFPCALGTLAAGQTATITSTFAVPVTYPGTTVTNTATVSTSTSEITTNNNSSATTATVIASAADVSITKTGPGGARDGEVISFQIVVRNNGPATAGNIVVSDPTPIGLTFMSNSGACTTPFPCSLGTLLPTQTATITATYRVSAGADSLTNTATVTSTPADANTANNSSSAVVSTGRGFTCPTRGPALTSPAANAVVTSPVTLSWTSVANAIGYLVNILQTGQPPIILNTGNTSVTVPLTPGAYTWFVSAAGAESCGPLASGTSSFSICTGVLGAPIPSVVGETTTGQTYNVSWTAILGASTYELQESTNASFTNPTVFTLDTNGRSFTRTATAPTPYFYRVRAISSCNPVPGPFGPSVSIVVVPVPLPTNHDPNVNVPAGSNTPVTWQIFIPGLPEGTTSFIASVDRPWLTVAPTSGILPPEGLTFTISADPSSLQNGTWTGTIVIVYGTTVISQEIAADGTTTKTVPVSISLVTPVTPTPLTTASNTAMIVPSVGHLSGVGSLWRSDIRLANLTAASQKFSLTFNGGTDPAALMKQTTISVDAGATTALDDIVRNWYGVGSLGTSSNGLLTVQPLDAAGKPLTSLSNVSAVSSRTFNAASTGTLGQFIPAVPFTKFIGSGANAATLSIQQIAQTAAFRTNLGIVEAAGQPAAVLVTAFDGAGAKLFELPLTIQAGEQRLLNAFLATNGVTSLENGRVEVRVTSGAGKVTAFASVVDNQSNDPMLIAGTPLGGLGASRFVVPGIADLTGGGANWRSDVRVFNGGAAPQSATLTFYPTGNGAPITRQVSVLPGQIQQLDDVLHSILGVTNTGGALHVTTKIDAPLVVTARTYDQTGTGTLGQFIPAVTTTDAVGRLDRALQILQAEESTRYRTNIGVAEVTGKAATAEIMVHLPDSKITPVLQVPLAAFESRQIGVLSTLGLANNYNVRVSVRVIDGDGKITAYGSVIDNATKDPTFIPAQ